MKLFIVLCFVLVFTGNSYGQKCGPQGCLGNRYALPFANPVHPRPPQVFYVAPVPPPIVSPVQYRWYAVPKQRCKNGKCS